MKIAWQIHLKEMTIWISGKNMGFSSERKNITGQINRFPESVCEFDMGKKTNSHKEICAILTCKEK